MSTYITLERTLESFTATASISPFFQSLPIKPLAYFPSERASHILLYNCHSLKSFRLPLASVSYKDIFLHIDRRHFNVTDFKRHEIDPKAYLNWLITCCKRRSFLYSCRPEDYPDILPSTLYSFTAIQDRRLLAEAYCLLIESRHYDSLEIPILDDHALSLICQLSPDIRIESNSLYLTKDLIHIFNRTLTGLI